MGISIIVPIYNVEPYITDCLQSVMRQTYQEPLECILVDDCGTDKSMAIVEELIAGYEGPIEFRIIHHEHNRGLSAARNTGMDAATGEYMYFLDSDDWISDDCIEKLAKPLQEREFDMVVGNYELVSEEVLPCPQLSEKEGAVFNDELCRSILSRGIFVMVVNKLFRKKHLQDNGLAFEEGLIHEDELFTFVSAMCISSCYVLHQTTYFYRIRENSIMRKGDVIERQIGYRPVSLCIVKYPDFSVQNPLHRQYIEQFLFNTFAGKLRSPFEFWRYYKELRNYLKYTPYQWYRQGVYSKQQLKSRFHFVLPPFVGFLWLLVRDIKNLG